MKGSRTGGRNSWLSQIDNPVWKAWNGYTYENVCFQHSDQIRKALGIGGIYSEISSWQSREKGAQIDMLIDRRDQVVSLCEIKFSTKPYTITASYHQELQKKLWAFQEETQTRKSVLITFITTFGLRQNMHSLGLIQNTVTMEELFEDTE